MDVNSTILWEPGSSKTPVYYDDVQTRIISTLSPDKNLFHRFHKEGEMFYMPCRSKLDLQLMDKHLESL